MSSASAVWRTSSEGAGEWERRRGDIIRWVSVWRVGGDGVVVVKVVVGGNVWRGREVLVGFVDGGGGLG